MNMPPSKPMMSPPSRPPMAGGAPAPSGGGDMPPEQAKTLLIQAIGELRKVAQKYGFSLEELMSSGRSGVPSGSPPPLP